MRRLLCLLIVSLLAAGPAVANAHAGDVKPAAYNKKKCKKAKTKKQKKKYCKKKKPPRAPTTTTTTPTTTTPTAPTTQNPTSPVTPTNPQQQVVRDDAGFTNALVGSKLHKTSEGT